MKDLRPLRQSRPGLAESIKSGLAVPILSDEALLDLALPGHAALAPAYADYAGYTLDDRENLPRMARFYKLQRQRQAQPEGQDFTASDLRADFFDFVKDFIYAHAAAAGADKDLLAEAEAQYADSTVTKFTGLLGYPRLDGGAADPLEVLANLPFRVLLTTSPYTFLEAGLAKAGKTSRTVVIRWRKDLRDLIDSAIPAVSADADPARFPLVCDLFGLESATNSLVLTEDDYLEFLVDVNLARGEDTRHSVLTPVRKALSGDLLVLGVSLKSWAFRALYAGLIKRSGKAKDRGVCEIQPPDVRGRAGLPAGLRRARGQAWGLLLLISS